MDTSFYRRQNDWPPPNQQCQSRLILNYSRFEYYHYFCSCTKSDPRGMPGQVNLGGYSIDQDGIAGMAIHLSTNPALQINKHNVSKYHKSKLPL